jgi:3D (Asp-Asp-Asp) domain-containing protein
MDARRDIARAARLLRPPALLTAIVAAVVAVHGPAAEAAGGAPIGAPLVTAASVAASGGATISQAPNRKRRAKAKRKAVHRHSRVSAPGAKKPSGVTTTTAPAGLTGGAWYHHVSVTEYWPAPESWFVGALVSAPGLQGLHRIDWLYSATGVSMEGEGVGLDGRTYHIDAMGSGGWLTAAGKPTSAADGFAAGAPYWRAGGYWTTATDTITFPLALGGWSAGAGTTYVPLNGVTFAAGSSLPLQYYQSIAVDPRVIPLGSRVYLPAYKDDGHGGWFVAQDTGGAIRGRHFDVFRPPPASPVVSGQSLTRQVAYVIKPSS